MSDTTVKSPQMSQIAECKSGKSSPPNLNEHFSF